MRTRCSDIGEAHRSFCPSELAVLSPLSEEKRFNILLYSQIKHAERGMSERGQEGGRQEANQRLIGGTALAYLGHLYQTCPQSECAHNQLYLRSFLYCMFLKGEFTRKCKFSHYWHIFMAYAFQVMMKPNSNSFNPHQHPQLNVSECCQATSNDFYETIAFRNDISVRVECASRNQMLFAFHL